jgi:hypothetical protein
MYFTPVKKKNTIEGISKKTEKPFKFTKQKVVLHKTKDIPQGVEVHSLPAGEVFVSENSDYKVGQTYEVDLSTFDNDFNGNLKIAELQSA